MKDMKKFILKLLIGGAIPCLIIILTNMLLVRTHYFQSMNGVSKFKEVPENIQLANFGNSHSLNGFDWSDYPQYTSADLSLASQSYVFDSAIFKQYLNHFDEDAVIVVDISHRSLYEEDPLLEMNSRVTRYYQVLDHEYMPGWTFRNALVYDYFPILSEKTRGIRYILNDTEPQETQVESALDINDPVKAGKNRADVFMKRIGSQELSLQYDALCEMIEIAQTENIRVLLVTVPTTSYFYEGFTPEFYDKFYSDIKTITDTYPNTAYIDYTGDERFEGLELYRNTDHLNPDGAKVFTAAVIEDLEVLGWLP